MLTVLQRTRSKPGGRVPERGGRVFRPGILAVAGLMAIGMGVLGARAAQTPPRDPKAPPAAQVARPPAPAGTGVIAGTVVSTDSGRPVRRATVIISGGSPRIARTA